MPGLLPEGYVPGVYAPLGGKESVSLGAGGVECFTFDGAGRTSSIGFVGSDFGFSGLAFGFSTSLGFLTTEVLVGGIDNVLAGFFL
jgi:hypothetical protein